MPTLKEVLADKSKYPDNLVWNLEGGTAVTLAQLRGLSDESQNAITKREADLVKAQQAIDAKQSELNKAQLNTATLYTGLQQAKEAIANGKFDSLPPEIKALFGNSAPAGSGNGNNDPFAALSRLENDTLLGPVVQYIKKVSDDARKAQEAVAANVEVQKKMATNYMNGVLEDRYDRIVPADKQEKFPLSTLIQEAVKSNQWASDSTPNIRAAYKSLTAGDTQAAHDAEVAAAAVKKYQEDHPVNAGGGGSDIFVPTPGGNFGLDVHNRSGAAPKPFKNLDEAFAAAANDKDIWANVDKTVQ
jgi:hypothetical protein